MSEQYGDSAGWASREEREREPSMPVSVALVVEFLARYTALREPGNQLNIWNRQEGPDKVYTISGVVDGNSHDPKFSYSIPVNEKNPTGPQHSRIMEMRDVRSGHWRFTTKSLNTLQSAVSPADWQRLTNAVTPERARNNLTALEAVGGLIRGEKSERTELTPLGIFLKNCLAEGRLGVYNVNRDQTKIIWHDLPENVYTELQREIYKFISDCPETIFSTSFSGGNSPQEILTATGSRLRAILTAVLQAWDREVAQQLIASDTPATEAEPGPCGLRLTYTSPPFSNRYQPPTSNRKLEIFNQRGALMV